MTVAWVSGLLVLLAAWLGPLARLAERSFAAHMTAHMAVVAVAAPLVAWGVSDTRFDPVRYMPRLFSAIPASMLEFVVVWAWHTPVLHHAARHLAWVRVVEQGSFLFSGLLLWLSIFGGQAHENVRRTGAGVLALLLTSMHMTLLGALIALPMRPLYVHGGFARLTPLEDQHLGGAIMLSFGGVVYLAGGLWLTASLLRRVRTQSNQEGRAP